MIRATALLLTVLTGFSGLVYEVTWEKYLATLLGSHSEATAALLGLYLGGLAIGYAMFGAVTTRVLARARSRGQPPRLILLYGLLEAGIGVWALSFAWLFRGAQLLSLAVPQSNAGLAFGFDVALCALLILPPATLMGGTIPMLTQALARGLEDATRFHALVYSFNTAGAFVGALAAGFWLVPTLGLVYTCVAMGAVNLGAGAVFAWIGTRTGADELAYAQSTAPAVSEGEATHRVISGFASFAAVALLTGFAMMSIQTVLIRIAGLSFGASQFTFSMVVAVFVLCIALGSFAVSALSHIPRWVLVADLWLLFAAATVLYTQLPDAPYWAHVLRALFEDDAANFYPYYLSAFASVLVVIGLPVALSGASLPLIFHHLRDEIGNLGSAAGRLYSWNTAGSLLGALLGGYAFLYWLNLDQVFQVALAALCVSAVVVTVRVTQENRIGAVALLLVPTLTATAFLPHWDPQKLSAGLFRIRTYNEFTFLGPGKYWRKRPKPWLRFYVDGPTASIAVIEVKGLVQERVSRSIVTNGKSDSNTVEDYPTMALLGLLPALFAERAERAFVIGYGAGGTVGELAALETMREVVVAEISQGVIDAAPWFDYANVNASKNPRVRIVRGDAYRTLLRSEDRYDVIVSEPSNPWVIGVEMLYSREFLEAARGRLTQGGVYAQWMHTYEIDDESLALVVRTYTDVFDHVSVWFGTGTDLLLLGFTDGETALDVDRLARRSERPDFRTGLARAGIDSVPALLAHELLPLGVIHAIALTGDRHTLLRPVLSYRAARGFFSNEEAALPRTVRKRATEIGERNALVGRYRKSRGDRLSEDDWAALVRETCRYDEVPCVTSLARWKYEVPRSANRKLIMREIREGSETYTPVNMRAFSRLDDLYEPRERYERTSDGDPEVASVAESTDPLKRARRATNDYVLYYHHAAPFSRSVLEELWRRCEADEDLRESCIQARSIAQRTLGRLEVGGS